MGLCLLGSGVLAQAAVVVVDDRDHRVELPSAAQRVVTLLPSLTETVCALGACDRLVGTDRYSNWPDRVRALPKLGGLDDTQIERIVALKPDLVLAAESTRAVARLEALGLRVLALEPRSLADTRRVIDRVARALGLQGRSEPLWLSMQQRIDAAAARVPSSLRGQRVYFEVASVPYAASEASHIGELMARLGLANIVPAVMGPFPQLSPEYILKARPDVVMGAAQAVAEMAQRPGWRELPALRRGASCAFGPQAHDALMRAGPRLAEAAEALAGCLAKLPVGTR